MSRQEFLERLLWAVDGYRFKYLDRTTMIAHVIRLIDENPEAVGQ